MNAGACPKSMTYGPCGGTSLDGSCEVDRRPCPFLRPDHATVLRHAATPSRTAVPLDPVPEVIVDVRAPRARVGDLRQWWRATARSLSGCAALLGEHVDNPHGGDDAGPVDPAVAIEELAGHGVAVIATVTGRDRDLTAAATTMRRYRAAGAAAIHCVTGDHPAAMSIDRPADFGAESITLIGLANDLGIAATAGESPASPGARVERVALKLAAGASACILNHSGDTADLIAFADACRNGGIDLPLVAPIPMIADAQAAAGLVQFPGLRLPREFVDVVVTAADPIEASISMARSMATDVARSGRFAGVNLSGSASGLDPSTRTALTNRFVSAVRDGWRAGAAARGDLCSG